MGGFEEDNMKGYWREGWVINETALAKIRDHMSRLILAAIMEGLDQESRNQTALVPLRRLLEEYGWHKNSVWRALAYLEKAGFIKRPENVAGWGMVYVNPFLKRPFHTAPEKAHELAKIFNPINPDRKPAVQEAHHEG